MARIQGQFSNTPWLGTRLEYYEKDYSVENNTSTVHVDAYILSLNGGYTTGEVTVVRDFYVTLSKKVDNNNDDYYLETKFVTVPRWTIVKNEVWKIGEFDFTVPHAPDGSRTIDINSSYNTGLSGIGASELSAELTLTKIARQSTVSCPDFNIGSATTININRANSNYVHTISYEFGSLSGIIAENTKETSFGWTPDASAFFQQIPNSNSGRGKLYCSTYNDGVQVGVTTEYEFNAFVVNSNPIVDITIKDSNSLTLALTGNADVLVKYISNANVITNATAQNYATIESSNILCGDGKSATGLNITLNNVESAFFTATIFDSRGNLTYETYQKTLIDYFPTSIKQYSATRQNPTSGNIVVSAEGTLFNSSFGVQSNSLNASFRYRQGSGNWSSYIDISSFIAIQGNNYSLNGTLPVNLTYQSQWDIELLVSDKLSSDTYTLTIAEGIPTAQMAKNEFQINGTIYQADKNGQNAVSIAEMIQSAVDELKPVTLFEGSLYSGRAIVLSNLSSYRKLEVTWRAYVGDSFTNTGGNAHVLTIDLTQPFTSGSERFCVAGAVVPYTNGSLGDSMATFSIRVNVNLTNNEVSTVIHYNNGAQGANDAYRITKIVGYK